MCTRSPMQEQKQFLDLNNWWASVASEALTGVTQLKIGDVFKSFEGVRNSRRKISKERDKKWKRQGKEEESYNETETGSKVKNLSFWKAIKCSYIVGIPRQSIMEMSLLRCMNQLFLIFIFIMMWCCRLQTFQLHWTFIIEKSYHYCFLTLTVFYNHTKHAWNSCNYREHASLASLFCAIRAHH